MANLVCNIAKGRVAEYYNRVKSNDPAASVFKIVALNVTGDQDDAIRDADNLQALLALSNVSEVTNTNYARATLTDSDLAALAAPDDVNNRNDQAIPQVTFSAIAAGTAWTDLVICYDAGGAGPDSAIIPMTLHDFAVTPDGNDIVINAGNFFRAQEPA